MTLAADFTGGRRRHGKSLTRLLLPQHDTVWRQPASAAGVRAGSLFKELAEQTVGRGFCALVAAGFHQPHLSLGIDVPR